MILVTPKYHCEIAGEGIEYSWGLSKKYYRKLPIHRKRTKDLFQESVRESLCHVRIDHARKFAAKARRYMLCYKHYAESGDKVSYDAIEKFVKTCKTHRSAVDQDTKFIVQIYRQSVGLPVTDVD